MKGHRFIVLVIMIVVLLSLPTPIQSQVPKLPHAFYGTLSLKCSPAPAGTSVEARGKGVITGIPGNPLVTDEVGYYGKVSPLASKLVVQGDIAEGTLLTFFVDGVSTGQTAEYHSGSLTQLNLALNQVDLVLSVSPAKGGSVVSPGEGTFLYNCGEVVRLIAQAGVGYEFVEWSGPVADPLSPDTTVTMNDNGKVEARFRIRFFSINAKVTLQGDGRPPEGYNIPVTLKLYNTAITSQNIRIATPVAIFTTDDGGIKITGQPTLEEIQAGTNKTIMFQVPQVAPGTYNITLYSPHCLVNLKNGVAVNEGTPVVDFGTLLEGDVLDITTGSLAIDCSDFATAVTAYENCLGDARWNQNVDFDRDGCITLIDILLLINNYGKTSPRVVTAR